MENKELIPDKDLENLRILDALILKSTKSMEDQLGVVKDYAVHFTKANMSIKEMQESMKSFDKTSEKVEETLLSNNKLIQDRDKLVQKVIETNSKETDSVKEVRKAYEDNTQAVENNAKTLKDISQKAHDEASKRMKGLTELIGESKLVLKQINAELRENDKAWEQGSISIEEYRDQAIVWTEAQRKTRNLIKETNSELKFTEKILNSSIGSYNSLSGQYSLMKLKLNPLNEDQKLHGKAMKEAQAHAKALYEEMSRLQKATGKHQLDVGKYDIAVRDLTKTLSLVDPRIGAILTKLQNISPLKKIWLDINDKLSKSLNITAKSATILQGAIVGLIVGGILIAIEAYKRWNDEQKKQEEFAKKQSEWKNKGLIDAQQELTHLKLLYEATQDVNKPMSERVELVEELQSKYPDYLSNFTEEEIIAGKATLAYEELTKSIIASAQARAATDKIVENQRAKIELDEKQIKLKSELEVANLRLAVSAAQMSAISTQADQQSYAHAAAVVESLKKQIASITSEMEALDKSSNRIAGSINPNDVLSKKNPTTKKTNKGKSADTKDADLKALQDIEQLKLQLGIDAQKLILESNKNSYDERVAALDIYHKQQSEKIRQAAEFQLAQSELTENQKELIVLKGNAELIKIAQEFDKLNETITKDYVTNQTKILSDGLAERNQVISQNEQEALSKLAEQYGAGSIPTRAYEQERLNITKQYAEERFNVELANFDAILLITDLTEEQREDIIKKKKDAELAYHKKINDQRIKNEENTAKQLTKITEDLAKEKDKLMKKMYDSLEDLAMAIPGRIAAEQLRDLDKQAEQNQKWRDNEIERIDDKERKGVISKEQADADKWDIEVQAKDREDEIAKQKEEVQKRQVLIEKGIAVAKIAIETAMTIAKINSMTKVAVAAATAASPLTLGQPWAGVIVAQGAAMLSTAIATGAAQTAAILAAAPKYKDGTGGHRGGLAVVGDGGRHELVVLPTGEMWKTPKTDTLVDLPKGTQVLPNYEKALTEMSLLSYHKEERPMVVIDNSESVYAVEKGNKLVKNLWLEQREANKVLLHNRKVNRRWTKL